MSTKNDLLEILERNRGGYVSGQELAGMLDVSRGAVWKAVRKLEEEGHRIIGVNNKGYRLESGSDVLTTEGIRLHLDSGWKDLRIQVYKSVDSTNSEAKRLPVGSGGGPLLLVANEQTLGKGRMGRRFHSPADTGVYMSLVLHPGCHFSDLEAVTIKAGIAVCRVIESLVDVKAEIKWVNDIFLDGRKVGGILTEADTDFESGMVETLIIGIGLNVRTRVEDFPEDLGGLAGSVFPVGVTRNEIAARLANEVRSLYLNQEGEDFLEEFRRRCFILGREIRYTVGGEVREGMAVGVDDAGHLIVEGRDGARIVLHSGEVSLGSGRL